MDREAVQKQREKEQGLAEKILSNSRNELYLSMRFLDVALWQFPYRKGARLKTIGTDGEGIWFLPDYLFQKYQESPVFINRCYLHMVLHGIFRHFPERQQWNMRSVLEREDWNLACDIAVEYLMDGMGISCIFRPLPEVRQDVYDWIMKKQKLMNAEGIFRFLSETRLDPAEYGRLSSLFSMDDHSLWQYEGQKTEDGRGNDGDPGQEKYLQDQFWQKRKEQNAGWKEISEKLQTNLETASRQVGDRAGQLLRNMRIENRRRYDYQSFLKRFLVRHEVMKADLDSFDTIFYYYGLKEYKDMPLIEPLESSEVKLLSELVIVIDTSGSCSGGLVKKFLEATYHMIKEQETGGRKLNLHLIQCDCEVQEDTVIHSQKELLEYASGFTIKGFGGTDFRPAFSYVGKLKQEGKFKDLKGLLYFTDGYGTFPQKRPSFDTAFLFLEEEGEEIQVPPWAMKVMLTELELEAALDGIKKDREDL